MTGDAGGERSDGTMASQFAELAAIAEKAATMTDAQRFEVREIERVRFEQSAFSFIHYHYGPYARCSREEAIRLFSAHIAQMMVANRGGGGGGGGTRGG